MQRSRAGFDRGRGPLLNREQSSGDSRDAAAAQFGEDDLPVLFTGGTTAMVEQGGGVGDEVEVGDDSVQGAYPLDASGSMQSKRMQEHMKQMVAGMTMA